jgi:hypothetical protein
LKTDTGLSEAQLAAMLNVSSINWKTQMLVVVTASFEGVSFLSPHPDITSLTENNGTLTVHWDSWKQNPHQAIPQYVVLADPDEFVLTSRFDGPVHFQFDGTLVLPLPPGTSSKCLPSHINATSSALSPSAIFPRKAIKVRALSRGRRSQPFGNGTPISVVEFAASSLAAASVNAITSRTLSTVNTFMAASHVRVLLVVERIYVDPSLPSANAGR